MWAVCHNAVCGEYNKIKLIYSYNDFCLSFRGEGGLETHNLLDASEDGLTIKTSHRLLLSVIIWLLGPPRATRQPGKCRAASSQPGSHSGTSCHRSAPVRSGWFWPGAIACPGSRCWRSWSQRLQWSRQNPGCGTGALCPTWASGTSSAFALCSSTSTSCHFWKVNRACWVRRDNTSAAL